MTGIGISLDRGHSAFSVDGKPHKVRPVYSTLSFSPPHSNLSILSTMGASDELAYLKSLVSQLNEKIASLESKAKTPVKTPAQQLRTILIGPPGAGTPL